MRTKRGILIASVVLSLAAAACTGRLTRENYDKVANGMTPKDVESILGPGTEQASTAVAAPSAAMPIPGSGSPASAASAKVLMWHSGAKAITVTFVNDKVAAKSQVGL